MPAAMLSAAYRQTTPSGGRDNEREYGEDPLYSFGGDCHMPDITSETEARQAVALAEKYVEDLNKIYDSLGPPKIKFAVAKTTPAQDKALEKALAERRKKFKTDMEKLTNHQVFQLFDNFLSQGKQLFSVTWYK